MGLFSDLFGSSSHTQTTQSTSNVSNTQLAGGGIGGPAVYGTGNQVTNVTTDVGAVAGGLLAATDISDHALALGAAELDAGTGVAIAGLNHASDAYTSSLALAGDVTRDALNNDYALSGAAIDSNSTFAGAALDRVARFSSSALDSNTYIAGKSLDALSSAYSSSLTRLADTQTGALNTVEGLAAQVSQSNQQSTDQTVTRVIGFMALAVVAIFLLKR